MSDPSNPADDDARSSVRAGASFVSRVAIVAGAAALLFIAWQIRHALILLFGGIVAAVVIVSLSDPIRRLTGLSRGPAVLTALLLILSAIALFGWTLLPEVRAQLRELVDALPDSIAEIDRAVGSWIPEGDGGGSMVTDIAQRVAAWSGTALAGLTTLVLVITAGVFLAVRPTAYRDGLVSLVSPERQMLLRRALNRTGNALKAWLRAQVAAMLFVGVTTGLATWALGLPAPYALGFIAGLLEFVPIIGPIAAAVPALLLALTVEPMLVVWTGLAYFAIQQVEANIFMPLAQQEAADLPPALLIFAFAAFGAVFGLAGVILSAPLSVALFSLVKDLYVRPLNFDPASPEPEKAD